MFIFFKILPTNQPNHKQDLIYAIPSFQDSVSYNPVLFPLFKQKFFAPPPNTTMFGKFDFPLNLIFLFFMKQGGGSCYAKHVKIPDHILLEMGNIEMGDMYIAITQQQTEKGKFYLSKKTLVIGFVSDDVSISYNVLPKPGEYAHQLTLISK